MKSSHESCEFWAKIFPNVLVENNLSDFIVFRFLTVIDHNIRFKKQNKYRVNNYVVNVMAGKIVAHSLK